MDNNTNARIYIGGLGDKSTMEDLDGIFADHMPYTDATVLRGFGFIQFPTEEAAQNAIKCINGTLFYGRKLTVKIANDNRGKNKRPANQQGNNTGNFRDRSPIDDKNRDSYTDNRYNSYNNDNNMYGTGNGGGGYNNMDQNRSAYQEPPPQANFGDPTSDSNDCEIIVVSRTLTNYAENVESRLKRAGLTVDLLFPNDDVPIGKVLANISSRGSLYAILITPENEEHHSITVNILYGQLAEHRNMPVDDAITFVTNNFNEKMRKEKTLPGQTNFNTSHNPSDAPPLKDTHPEAIQNMVNLLASNRQLTVLQYERLIKYLTERKEMQLKEELGDDVDPSLASIQILTNVPGKTKAETEEELQKKIMDILNKPAITSTLAVVPEPEPVPVKAIFPSVANPSQPPPQKTQLLHDPKVQKALDSLLHGNLLQGFGGGGGAGFKY